MQRKEGVSIMPMRTRNWPRLLRMPCLRLNSLTNLNHHSRNLVYKANQRHLLQPPEVQCLQEVPSITEVRPGAGVGPGHGNRGGNEWGAPSTILNQDHVRYGC